MTSEEWKILGICLLCAGIVILAASQILLSRYRKRAERRQFRL